MDELDEKLAFLLVHTGLQPTEFWQLTDRQTAQILHELNAKNGR